MKLHWSQDLKGDIKDFSFRGVASLPPLRSGVSKYNHNNLFVSEALIKFLTCFKINKDILSTFEHYILRTEIIEFEYCCKMVKNRCKSAQTSTKYWSIILKFGQKINWRILNLIA